MSLVKGTAASIYMEEYFFTVLLAFLFPSQIVGMLLRYSD